MDGSLGGFLQHFKSLPSQTATELPSYHQSHPKPQDALSSGAKAEAVQEASQLGGGNSKILGMFSPTLGEMIQFDGSILQHIFQMGWFNHQPDKYKMKTCRLVTNHFCLWVVFWGFQLSN